MVRFVTLPAVFTHAILRSARLTGQSIVLLRENYANREDFVANTVGRACSVAVTLQT